MSHKLKLHIRIDDTATNQIYRFEEEQYPVTSDVDNDKLYRLKIVSGVLTQQEVEIIDGVLTEVGEPITYVTT